MPKPSTYPIIINQEKTLTTGYLSKCGYFEKDYKVTGSTGWISNKSKDLDINITSIMEKDKERIILNYIDFDNKPVKQIIYLTSKKSNLGTGLIWFFICPYSGAICRNLIFVFNRFMHRSNLKNAMYGTQLESKYWRKLFQLIPNIPTVKNVLNEPYKPNYKKHYKGIKTKRYQKYLSTVKRWNDNLKERTN
ncbi:hypothetical protein K8354_02695 [Polaribacter litorisediminis]|uniref:hypothetical protein n=1 Tax=Polaribacter litorisediminis TaxID=1908341 RepID=UPI001CBC8B93|nr:hypothetical protein [Polaribacter litorisediminis]UAM98751.1 hypothetical protein K8354_02695 [Polaribacter litorisediminis]